MPAVASQHGGQALHGVNLLPGALCTVAVLAYLAIFGNHVRHARETSGQRRLWHLGHVVMALGMAYMFVPASAVPFTIADGRWQALYGIGLALVAAWLLCQALSRGGASGLWLLLAADLLAMLYMWSPGAMQGSLSWLFVVYLTAEALVWSSGRIVGVDRNLMPARGYSVSNAAVGAGAGAGAGARESGRPPAHTGTGALSIAATATLACERDLRVSMSAMTLGMAYMVLAMQVVH
jgi:hypothetical protein